MFRRFGFFFFVNIGIVLMLSMVLNLLGVKPYLTSYGLDYVSLGIFCLVWGTGGAFISLMISKWIAKKMYGVQIIESHSQMGWVVNAVHDYAKKAGLHKMPEVGIYESPEINAFATGPSKSNSLVAVSTGLLQKMDRDQVEGVLGHEVSHIANGDMVTMTLIQGIMNAFVMFLARIVAFAIDNATRGNDNRGGGLGIFGYMITVFVFEMIFGLIGQIFVSYFSRAREYRADYGGALLAGRDKMISSLQALQKNYETMVQVQQHESSGQKYFHAMQISSKQGLMRLLSTHPPLTDRIEALKNKPIV